MIRVHALAYMFISLFLSKICNTYGQNDTIKRKNINFSSELAGLFADSQTPFWLRANKYGTIPLQNPIGLLNLQGSLIYKGSKSNSLEWHLQAGAVANLAQHSQVFLPTGQIGIHYKGMDFYIGRRKEVVGLGDTLMGSGFYAWSGNALPIPKIHIGTKGFVPLNFTKGFVAIHGTLSHGWFGKEKFASNYYLHQKSIFVRLGKPTQQVAFFLGVAHFAQWGGNAPLLVGKDRTGPNGELPSSFQDFLYVFTAKKFPQSSNLPSFDSENRVGNHLGSVDFALSFHQKNGDWLFYLQHPAENMPGVFGNFPDGLYGIRWVNKKLKKPESFKICQITLELLTTLDQGVFYNSIIGGYQGNGYFNNSQYMDGWSYKGRIIGTPFIMLRTDTRKEWFNVMGTYANGNYWQINSNSVRVLYLGMKSSWNSQNQLEFKIAPSQHSFYLDGNGKYGKVVSQFSGLAQYRRKLSSLKNITLTTSIATDWGEILPNSISACVSLKKDISY